MALLYRVAHDTVESDEVSIRHIDEDKYIIAVDIGDDNTEGSDVNEVLLTEDEVVQIIDAYNNK